jgi:predicted DNA-binding transcriptional regulator AlpA
MGELLTIPQVMQMLHRKKTAIYALMKLARDPLPFIQIEGGRLVDRSELEAWLDRRKVGRHIAPVLDFRSRARP